MRVNIYSEELSDEIHTVWSKPLPQPDGAIKKFCGVRFYLHSSDKLHDSDIDDDRSAVTFWFESPEHAHDVFQRARVRCEMEAQAQSE